MHVSLVLSLGDGGKREGRRERCCEMCMFNLSCWALAQNDGDSVGPLQTHSFLFSTLFCTLGD